MCGQPDDQRCIEALVEHAVEPEARPRYAGLVRRFGLRFGSACKVTDVDTAGTRMDLPGIKTLIDEAWQRYHRTIAVTEAHTGSIRQVREEILTQFSHRV